jgi:hypothetical protein
MTNYRVRIETFDTPVLPGESFRNHKIETFEIPGFAAAKAFAKLEAAKGAAGRVVTLRNGQGLWRKT